MSRKIPNKPHPTPDPDHPLTGETAHLGGFAMVGPGGLSIPKSSSGSRDDLAQDEPNYDSCFDDLNQVLSQSMEQPDPDPFLESSAAGHGPGDGADPQSGRGRSGPRKAPRTSEIFRSIAASGGGAGTAGDSTATGDAPGTSGEVTLPGLDTTEQRSDSRHASAPTDRTQNGAIPWGQIALLSYSSVLTCALIWIFWTGRIPKAADPAPAEAEKPAVDFARRPAESDGSSPTPLIPAENVTRIGVPVRLGDLEVTPLAIEATPVELVRTIDLDRRRREDRCLVLRLRLANRSNDRAFTPLDRSLVRERDFRAYDPFIVGSRGETIRLFPLAIDSEWSIVGQDFPTLQPGETAETLIAAETGGADRLAEEMTWRVRLRIGVYRSDMLGVRFTRADVRHSPDVPRNDEEPADPSR
jgi:hypothetical protein